MSARHLLGIFLLTVCGCFVGRSRAPQLDQDKQALRLAVVGCWELIEAENRRRVRHPLSRDSAAPTMVEIDLPTPVRLLASDAAAAFDFDGQRIAAFAAAPAHARSVGAVYWGIDPRRDGWLLSWTTAEGTRRMEVHFDIAAESTRGPLVEPGSHMALHLGATIVARRSSACDAT